jgi:uncharacterized YccA/Bax inhibitor family protein
MICDFNLQMINPMLKKAYSKKFLRRKSKMNIFIFFKNTILLLGLLLISTILSFSFITIEMFHCLKIFILVCICLCFLTFLYPKLSSLTGIIFTLLQGLIFGILGFILHHIFKIINITHFILLITTSFSGLFLFNKIRLKKSIFNFFINIIISILLTNLIAVLSQIILTHSVPCLKFDNFYSICFNILFLLFSNLNTFFTYSYIRQLHKLKPPKFMEWYLAFGYIFHISWFVIFSFQIMNVKKDYV